jgi:hypothetical protein
MIQKEVLLDMPVIHLSSYWCKGLPFWSMPSGVTKLTFVQRRLHPTKIHKVKFQELARLCR